jgi:hypothetical protein
MSNNCDACGIHANLTLLRSPGRPIEELCPTCLPVVIRRRLGDAIGFVTDSTSDSERRLRNPVLRRVRPSRHSVTRDAPHPRLGRRQLSGVTRINRARSCSAAQPGPLDTRQACAEHDCPARSGMVWNHPLRCRRSSDGATRAGRGTPVVFDSASVTPDPPVTSSVERPVLSTNALRHASRDGRYTIPCRYTLPCRPPHKPGTARRGDVLRPGLGVSSEPSRFSQRCGSVEQSSPVA